MNEEIRTKLEQALNEPAAPEALVTKTIRRCKLVSAGRRAEEALAAKGNAVGVQERRTLAADGILGRMALQREVPEALSTQRLVQEEGFCRLADRPAEQLLAGLQKGTIFREIAAAGKPAAQKQGANVMTQENPVKKAPERSGPMR